MGFKEFNKYRDGVYVSVGVDAFTQENIKKYMKENLEGIQQNDSLHCTLIYSQKPLDREVDNEKYETFGTFKSFSLFGDNKDVLVVELVCEKLVERNKELVDKYKFISDFSEYKPHLTLAYKVPEDFDVCSLPEIDFKINFINEHTEPLDNNWTN